MSSLPDAPDLSAEGGFDLPDEQPSRVRPVAAPEYPNPFPRHWEWIATFLIVALAALLRFWALGRPSTLVFDETYYVKDAFTLWQLGFEAKWPADIDTAFAAGDIHTYLNEAGFVVHPQVGKWLIALGLMIGGAENAWAWRLSSAVIGVLAVFLVIRIARRLFNSPGIGLIAGLLMAIDGAAIVHSRIALLDQFLMFFVLAAFGALLLDREQLQRQLTNSQQPGLSFVIQPALTNDAEYADTLANDAEIAPIGSGGWRNVRWWRLVAGVLLGLACGVKWSGAYFLAGFGLLTVLWDFTAYRTLARETGRRFREFAGKWLHDAVKAFLALVPVAALTYLTTWFSWFATPGAWGREWANNTPGQGLTWLPPLLRSWVHYHQQMWTFHNGLTDSHPYASQAYTWLLQIRPTSFYWGTEETLGNYAGCSRLADCAMAINSLGNPVLWWLATLALLVTIVMGGIRRDWRALAATSGLIFGWLPWLLYPERTTFAFYAIVFLPWLIFTLCYVYSVIRQRPWGRAIIAISLGAIIAISVAFYPIWTAKPVERTYWNNLMWLTTWI